jgi:thiol-disulfide isomerase/thioredoxin
MRLNLVQIGALSAGLALAAGFGSYQLFSRVLAPSRESSVDPFHTPLVSLDGSPRRLNDWPARLRVVNFWATWCAPCMREIPAFIELQARYGVHGVQFIGIAVDEREAVAQFAGDAGINYPILLGEAAALAVGEALGNSIGALPYTVLLAPDNRILQKHYGEWHRAEAEAYLSRFSASAR